MRGWLAALWMGIHATVAREVRSRSRGWRPVALLTTYLILMAAGLTGFVWLLTDVVGMLRPQVGLQVFSALALGATLLLSFIPPAITAGAVSGERERKTLDLILVTAASPLGLAAGKLLGSVLYVLFLLAAALPAFALVYLYGGVPLRHVAVAVGVAAATAVGYAALALWLSALFRRTLVALVATYLLVLGTLFVVPVAVAVRAQAIAQRTGGVAGPPPAIAYTSPLLALSSALPGGTPGVEVPLLSEILRMALNPGGGLYGGGVHVTYLVAGGMARAPLVAVPATPAGQVFVRSPLGPGGPAEVRTVTLWAPWVYYLCYTGGLVILSLVGTALSLNPVKPWRRWWRAWRRHPVPAPGTAA